MLYTQSEKMEKKKQNPIVIYIIDLLAIVLLTWFDQFTKSLAVQKLMNKKAFNLIPNVLQFRYLENRGAAFGMMQNQKWFFLFIGIAFLIVAVFFLIRIPIRKKYTILRACLVILAAGAVGNMIDRVFLGYVIDFIFIIYINFPIFNVADCYVTVSTALLIIIILFYYKEDDLNLKKARTPRIHSSMREPMEGTVTMQETADEVEKTDEIEETKETKETE